MYKKYNPQNWVCDSEVDLDCPTADSCQSNLVQLGCWCLCLILILDHCLLQYFIILHCSQTKEVIKDDIIPHMYTCTLNMQLGDRQKQRWGQEILIAGLESSYALEATLGFCLIPTNLSFNALSHLWSQFGVELLVIVVHIKF